MLQKLDALAFRYRAPLLVLAAAPLVLAGLDGPRPAAPALAGGVALVALGAALRLASIRWLGKRARVSRAKATILVARGPYARVRNPLYLAALLIIAGLGVMTGLGAWTLAPVLAVWLIYDRVVRHEERALSAAHDDLGRAYVRAVPRWLPLRRAFDGPPVEREPWGEVLGREWRLLCGLPAAVVGLAVLALTPARDALREAVVVVAAALGMTLPAFVVVGAIIGGLLNALKTEYDMARKELRRAQQAAAALAAAVAAPPGATDAPETPDAPDASPPGADHDVTVAPVTAAGRAS